MIERISNLIIAINVILLALLIILLMWRQKKYGSVSEKRLALILCLFLSFFFFTIFIPLFTIDIKNTIIIDIIFQVLVWAVGFPFLRWFFRKINQK